MKFLRNLAFWFGRIRETGEAAPFEVDPLDHPAIRRMRPRDLADLPVPRWRAQCR